MGTPNPTREQTNTTENITFPKTTCAGGNDLVTYNSDGAKSGLSILFPAMTYCLTSKLSMSGYGVHPRVISSHSNTPNDHYTKTKYRLLSAVQTVR